MIRLNSSASESDIFLPSKNETSKCGKELLKALSSNCSPSYLLTSSNLTIDVTVAFSFFLVLGASVIS